MSIKTSDVKIIEANRRLILSFDYHYDAVALARALPGSKYLPDSKSWSVSVKYAKRVQALALEIEAILQDEMAFNAAVTKKRKLEIQGWARPKAISVDYEDGYYTLRFSYNADIVAAIKQTFPMARFKSYGWVITAIESEKLRGFLAEQAEIIARKISSDVSEWRRPLSHDDEIRDRFLSQLGREVACPVALPVYGPTAPVYGPTLLAA